MTTRVISSMYTLVNSSFDGIVFVVTNNDCLELKHVYSWKTTNTFDLKRSIENISSYVNVLLN